MTTLSKTFTLPNMVYQADMHDVTNAVMECTRADSIDFDLPHHSILVRYIGEEAVPEIVWRLDSAGFPVANA